MRPDRPGTAWLWQIENEYGNIDSAYGAPGKTYMRWAAGMAVSLDTGVPWVMCQQADAPDPLVRDVTRPDPTPPRPDQMPLCF